MLSKYVRKEMQIGCKIFKKVILRMSSLKYPVLFNRISAIEMVIALRIHESVDFRF